MAAGIDAFVKCAMITNRVGGWNFDNNEVTYNCFNCGYTAKQNENEYTMSNKTKNLLLSFNIPEDVIVEYLSERYFNQNSPAAPTVKKSAIVVECDLPPDSYRLKDASDTDAWAYVAREYLSSRSLSVTDYDWYLSSDKDYRDRLIIPFYQNKKLVYWQARAFDPDAKQRYLNADKPKSNIIFNHDVLYKKNQRIFIPEGVFDAIPFNTISLIGGSLPDSKVEILQKFNKDYVFVIDEDLNGYKVGKKAISLGWKISHLSDGVDISKAIKKYGKIFTAKMLNDNIKEDMSADIWLEFMKAEFERKEKEKKKR